MWGRAARALFRRRFDGRERRTCAGYHGAPLEKLAMHIGVIDRRAERAAEHRAQNVVPRGRIAVANVSGKIAYQRLTQAPPPP